MLKVHILQSQKKTLQYLKKYKLSRLSSRCSCWVSYVSIFMFCYWNEIFSDFLGRGLCMYALEGGKGDYSARYVQFLKYRFISKNVFVSMNDVFYEMNISSCKRRLKCFIPCKTHWETFISDWLLINSCIAHWTILRGKTFFNEQVEFILIRLHQWGFPSYPILLF